MTAAQLLTAPGPARAKPEESVMSLGEEFAQVFAETVETVLRQEPIPRPQTIDSLAAPALAWLCRALYETTGCATVRTLMLTPEGTVRIAARCGDKGRTADSATETIERSALFDAESEALESCTTAVTGLNGGTGDYGLEPARVGVPIVIAKRAVGTVCLSYPTGGAPASGLVRSLEALVAEIATTIEAEIGRQRERTLLGSFLAMAPYAAAVADPSGTILWTNGEYTRLSGRNDPAEIDGPVGKALSGSERCAAEGQCGTEPIIHLGVSEVVGTRPDGSSYNTEEAVYAVKDRQGRTANLIAVYKDLTDRREAEERARYAAQHDALTGLPNRFVFNDRLNVATAQSKRNRRMVALLLLDLHQFKLINATYGHEGGDAVLIGAAQRLQDCVRDVDTVARLGSDEFAVIQTDIGHIQDVARLAQRIIDAFASAPFSVGGTESPIGINIGITVFPADDGVPANMLGNADVALRRAVSEGRNNYLFYTAAMGDQVRERLDLVNGIHQAIERNELILHYQPQVEVSSGRIIGSEALLRWVRPGIGMVPPGAFIDAAEQSGLIVPIGTWAMREACMQVKRWQAQGLQAPPVAVNMSAVQLHSRDLLETIIGILRETGVNPEMLEIEITESMLMQDAERASATLRRLSDLGIHIAVDDFGTGHSSLNYLKRLPVDKLKIDRSFVREVPGNFQDSAISKAIIGLGHSLALKVIAEGVEMVEQLDFLSREGCDEVQGYFFARPQPADAWPSLLSRGTFRQ
ncbi:MAG: hypothetical protein CMM50_03875 [Rhodospirillaceae bacterium]|nr:hypothetical protein [Rhodospirillaceae bacterium]